MEKTLFQHTEQAFVHKSDLELKKARFIFWLMGQNTLSSILSNCAVFLLKIHFPIEWLIKKTVYQQFCGGETAEEYGKILLEMKKNNMHAILDYSVEGNEQEVDFEHTKSVLISLLDQAKDNSTIPCICLKVTGLARFLILEKVSANQSLSSDEQKEWDRVLDRMHDIALQCLHFNKPLYIDAEESWIQPAIDFICEQLMEKYNTQKIIVYTTLQMYRHDRLPYLEQLFQNAQRLGYKLGVKLVRGAYLEKENKRALDMGYVSPIHTSKNATDADYQKASDFCFDHRDYIDVCLGTHNETSCLHIIDRMGSSGLPNNYQGIWFSQLFGMSDHISYNLSTRGYQVSKYLPFGPVKKTMPYLIRRAEENSSIAGQMSKEFLVYDKEIKRRKRL